MSPIEGSTAAKAPSLEAVAEAWRSISSMVRSKGQADDVGLEVLSAAILAQSIRASRLPPLRLSIRRHLRRGWEEGVILPLARSRGAVDRVLLQALPRDILKVNPADVRTTLSNLATQIPAELPPRNHVALALRYLEDFDVLARASASLDALTVAVDARVIRRSLTEGLSDAEHRTDLITTVIAEARQAWASNLAPVAGRLIRALDTGALSVGPGPGPRAGAGMARAHAALRVHNGSSLRRLGVAGPTRRERLILALTDDLVEYAQKFVESSVSRHAGLQAMPAAYVARGKFGGRAAVSLARAGVTVSQATIHDFAGEQLQQEIVLTTGTYSRPTTFEEAEAILDDNIPAPLDTPAHRTLRRIRRSEAFSGLPMVRSGTQSVTLGDLAGRRIHPNSISWLTAVADEDGTTLRISPGDDPRLVAMITAAGFSWVDGDQMRMVRSPLPSPASAPSLKNRS